MATLHRQSRTAVVVLCLVAGAVVGGALWHVLSPVLPQAMAGSFPVGTSAPWTLDLYFVQLTLGIVVRFNIGTAVGVLAAAFLVRR